MGGTLIKSDRLAVGTAGGTEDIVEAGKADALKQARRLAEREFRPRRTPLGLAAALLILAGGSLIAIEVVTAMLGEPLRLVPADRWAAGLRDTAWQDVGVRRVAAALAVLGGAMVLPALLPRRHPRMMPMQGADPRVAAAVSRQAVLRSLAAATVAVPGIERARVRMTRFRRQVSVRARTGYRNQADLADLVRAAVAARLGELDLMDPPVVRVRLHSRKDSRKDGDRRG
jgi:Family of unknown function (DUF6286)